ncbi:MucR family transcriptional regulator [Marinovum sp.]|uniref:MucR family transcriptional regulator n=1 Tax=Marinovum sp. TaxID=2024839 RepID=UPI002B2720F9|nr:MucR family transcriptional regulator [Marinovum sp.]
MNSQAMKEETAGRIVAAYASRPDVGPDQIVALYRRLAEEFSRPGGSALRGTAAAPGELRPALPIDQAVSEDRVTCLCCGRSFKMLKRHLGAEHGMTEAAYRAAFNLPEDFPLVAPSYSRKKANHAKQAGLGKYERSVVTDEA